MNEEMNQNQEIKSQANEGQPEPQMAARPQMPENPKKPMSTGLMVVIAILMLLIGGGIGWYVTTTYFPEKEEISVETSPAAKTTVSSTPASSPVSTVNPGGGMTPDSNGIMVGKLTIDQTQINEFQQAVDDGQQSWRLDALELAKGDAGDYGFSSNDTSKFTLKSIAASAGVAEINASHNGKNYLIMVIKPTPGDGKIWTISEIKAL